MVSGEREIRFDVARSFAASQLVSDDAGEDLPHPLWSIRKLQTALTELRSSPIYTKQPKSNSVLDENRDERLDPYIKCCLAKGPLKVAGV